MRIPILVVAAAMSSCSVYMAADKKGVDLEEVLACKSKTCLITNQAEPMPDAKFDEPHVQAFKVRKASGSTARAAMNGLLDVATIGLWEVAGTPMEGHLDKSKYIGLRVTFADDNETIKSIQTAQ